MLTAAAQIVAEEGYERMSVSRVTARAGVSRRTFYDLFEDREDCLLAVFDRALARVSVVAGEAYARESGRWRERVRAGLDALLEFLDDEPGIRSLVIVDVLGAGTRVLERRARVLDTLRGIVDGGRGEARATRVPPPLTAEGVVGAVLAVVHARLLEEDPRPLAGLLNELMAMIVLPYLGPAAAARELERPAPKTTRVRGPAGVLREPPRDPLEGLKMRLTYRTLRVLAVIEAEPGASNRRIADQAGISDQGQMSRLLVRLEGLGLVENTGLGPAMGEPNAWRLTPRGQEVERVTRVETERFPHVPSGG
jgi:AcrR family transcriptional regulator